MCLAYFTVYHSVTFAREKRLDHLVRYASEEPTSIVHFAVGECLGHEGSKEKMVDSEIADFNMLTNLSFKIADITQIFGWIPIGRAELNR
jgi:hypothetical protein